MKNIDESLTFLGLDTKEKKILLGLMLRKTSTVSELSRSIKLARTTVSPILRKLEHRGLVSRLRVGFHKEWRLISIKELDDRIKGLMSLFSIER